MRNHLRAFLIGALLSTLVVCVVVAKPTTQPTTLPAPKHLTKKQEEDARFKVALDRLRKREQIAKVAATQPTANGLTPNQLEAIDKAARQQAFISSMRTQAAMLRGEFGALQIRRGDPAAIENAEDEAYWRDFSKVHPDVDGIALWRASLVSGAELIPEDDANYIAICSGIFAEKLRVLEEVISSGEAMPASGWAQPRTSPPLYYSAGTFGEPEFISGFRRRDGTYVRTHWRTKADNSFWNNYSSYGNYNPHTGKRGTRRY